MNYLKNIVAFESFAELHQINDKSYRLWHALMSINNACGWLDWFEVPLIRLQSKLVLTNPQTIYKARNQLMQLGLLEFKKGSRGQSATYHLIPLVKEIVKPDTQPSLNNSLTNGLNSSLTNSLNNGLTNPLTLNKQNKTKQNKTNSSSESPTPNEKKAEPEKKAKREYDHQSEPYRLAAELKTGIMANNPDHKKITESQLQSWADDMRKMLELDKRSYSQVSNMISWCQRDDFWKTNILSASKLRKQYDQMRVRAMNEWQQQKHKPLLTNEERDGHFG